MAFNIGGIEDLIKLSSHINRPGLEKFSFMKTISKIWKEEEGEHFPLQKSLFIVPDLFKIDYKNKEIHCHEIEDSSMLSKGKLFKYIDLWFYYDSVFWIVRLFVYDRYGLNKRELPLCSLFYAQIRLDLKNKK